MNALLAGAASAAAVALAWWIHSGVRGWLPEDAPHGTRKQHRRVTPMVGFVPAAVSIAVCALEQRYWLAGACAVAALAGTIDDVKKQSGDGLGALAKGLLLVLAGALAAVEVAVSTDLGIGWLVAAGVAVFVLSNAANFLDNTDGVATALGGTALLLVGGIGTPLGCVWLAFLPFNWPFAFLFLGDGGALPLGVLAGTLAICAAANGTSPDPLALVAPVAVLWLDFCQVVVARIVLGYAPWIADRRHLTHLVRNAGVPSALVAPCFAALALGLHWALMRVNE